MSLSKRLGAYSVAAGTAAMGVTTVAQGELQIYDHRAAPHYARVSYAESVPPLDMAVVHMDGTLKYAFTDDVWGSPASYTYYDENGAVTTPIDAADKTADSVWFSYEVYSDWEGWDKEGVDLHTNVGNGVAGFDNGLKQEAYRLEDGDFVGSALNYYTDGSGAAIFGFGAGGSGNNDGWTGNAFVGFKLEEPNGTHYGWVNIDQPPERNQTYILGWGYQDEPGLPAPAGYSPPTGSFNGNFEIDDVDIDMLADAIRTGSVDFATYDLSGPGEDGVPDGAIDINDLDYLIHQLVFTTAGTTGSEYGDFNLDGKIDNTDLTRLATYYGSGDWGWDDGNANRNIDTNIDNTDLTILATYYGFGEPDTVPEPATLSLLALGASGLLARRRRRA